MVLAVDYSGGKLWQIPVGLLLVGDLECLRRDYYVLEGYPASPDLCPD